MADEPNVIPVVLEDESEIPAPPYSRLERLLVTIIGLLDTSGGASDGGSGSDGGEAQ